MMKIHDMSAKTTSPIHHIRYFKEEMRQNYPIKNYNTVPFLDPYTNF
jgi:hypothetical protein